MNMKNTGSTSRSLVNKICVTPKVIPIWHVHTLKLLPVKDVPPLSVAAYVSAEKAIAALVTWPHWTVPQ